MQQPTHEQRLVRRPTHEQRILYDPDDSELFEREMPISWAGIDCASLSCVLTVPQWHVCCTLHRSGVTSAEGLASGLQWLCAGTPSRPTSRQVIQYQLTTAQMLTVFVGQYGVYLKQQVKSLVWIAKGVPAGALAACPLPVFELRKPEGVLDLRGTRAPVSGCQGISRAARCTRCLSEVPKCPSSHRLLSACSSSLCSGGWRGCDLAWLASLVEGTVVMRAQ